MTDGPARARAQPDVTEAWTPLKLLAWTQGHFAEIRSEGREEFLGQPSRAEQPLTLRAVGDGDPGTRHIHRGSIWDLHRLSDG